jgi:hypothetical protein
MSFVHEHVTPPFVSRLQSRPQVVQFWLVTRLVHLPEQQPISAPVHALPHAPHCMTSLIRSTQLPPQQV